MAILEHVRRFLGLDAPHTSVLLDEFVSKAQRFYPDPETVWEQISFPQSNKVWYVLKNDAARSLFVERMVYVERELAKLWTRIRSDASAARRSETEKLRACLDPPDGVSRIVQKPRGGYDVRAYAHDAWIFVEIPTFASVEQGTDGVNATESRRRQTVLHILIHELAHVAGYWEHDDKHSRCVAWLSRYLDSN